MKTLYTYQPRKKPPQKKPRPEEDTEPRAFHFNQYTVIAVAVFVTSALISVGVAAVVVGRPEVPVVSKTPDLDSTSTIEEVEKVLPLTPSIVMTPNLAISTAISSNPNYEIGVAIQDVSTGEHISYGSEKRFVAASTGKLLTAAAYYNAVEQGKASLSAILGGSSAAKQIELMINQSKNDSWDALIANLGMKNITKYSKSIHIDYVTDGNTVTAASMASFLAELYNGNVLNANDTAQLLSYMQNTNNETLIPAVIPDDITVYHKYGYIDDVLHDVAILVKGDKAYTLAVYTKGNDSPSVKQQTEVIRTITRAATLQLFNEN